MNKIEKRSDLYREYARVIDMCEGTNVNHLYCVKWYDKLGAFEPHLLNTSDINTFKFAIAIVENKPVFVGDVLYNKENGNKITVSKVIKYHAFEENNMFGIGVDLLLLNPPKPKTFNLNGVELPLPDAKVIRTGVGVNIVDTYNNNISQCYSITFCGIEYNWSRQEDRYKVSLAITNLLSGK